MMNMDCENSNLPLHVNIAYRDVLLVPVRQSRAHRDFIADFIRCLLSPSLFFPRCGIRNARGGAHP